jgi:iron-sulfur cluster assembly protein
MQQELFQQIVCYFHVMIFISDKAKERVLDIWQQNQLTDNHFVRVSVTSGGCSGLSYQMNFDHQTKPGDEVFEDKGIKIVVDPKSLLYLLGTTLDFSEGLNGKGFYFNNPNAARTCSCGESFSL